MSAASRFGIVFVSLTAAFLFLCVSALADDPAEFRETWIVSFCKDPKIYQEMHDLAAQGDGSAAMMHYMMAVKARRCVDVTQYGIRLSFLASKIHKQYEINPSGEAEPTVVLEGHMVGKDDVPKEETVYVWTRLEHLKNFQKSSVPAPDGPEFRGWQDV